MPCRLPGAGLAVSDQIREHLATWLRARQGGSPPPLQGSLADLRGLKRETDASISTSRQGPAQLGPPRPAQDLADSLLEPDPAAISLDDEVENLWPCLLWDGD